MKPIACRSVSIHFELSNCVAFSSDLLMSEVKSDAASNCLFIVDFFKQVDDKEITLDAKSSDAVIVNLAQLCSSSSSSSSTSNSATNSSSNESPFELKISHV